MQPTDYSLETEYRTVNWHCDSVISENYHSDNDFP